jgi:hypothetical protein
MPDENHSAKHIWVNIAKQVLTFVVGVVTAAFVLGGARQRITELTSWKAETAPRIERMDSIGSLSFDHFHKQYEKDQTRIDDRLKDLEKEIRTIERANNH